MSVTNCHSTTHNQEKYYTVGTFKRRHHLSNRLFSQYILFDMLGRWEKGMSITDRGMYNEHSYRRIQRLMHPELSVMYYNGIALLHRVF